MHVVSFGEINKIVIDNPLQAAVGETFRSPEPQGYDIGEGWIPGNKL